MTDILEKKQIIETDAEQISLPGFVRLVKARKKLFYVVMPIVLVVAICTRFAGIRVWNRLEQYAIL